MFITKRKHEELSAALVDQFTVVLESREEMIDHLMAENAGLRAFKAKVMKGLQSANAKRKAEAAKKREGV